MLRNDSQTLRKRVTQLEAQVQALTSELEPVKAEARDAKAELESRMQQIAQLERENSKWKERNQQILRKVRMVVDGQCSSAYRLASTTVPTPKSYSG